MNSHDLAEESGYCGINKYCLVDKHTCPYLRYILKHLGALSRSIKSPGDDVPHTTNKVCVKIT